MFPDADLKKIFPVQNTDQAFFTRSGVGKGWEVLLEKAVGRLTHLVPGIIFLQAKEKFGGLRLYHSLPSHTQEMVEEVHKIIREAEADSFRTCERCGAPGNLIPKGWWKTLCPSCQGSKA